MTRRENSVYKISQEQVDDALAYLSRLSKMFNLSTDSYDRGYFGGFLSALFLLDLITHTRREELSFYYHL